MGFFFFWFSSPSHWGRRQSQWLCGTLLVTVATEWQHCSRKHRLDRFPGSEEENTPMCWLISSLRSFSIIYCQEAGMYDLIPAVGPSLFLGRITCPIDVSLEEGSWSLSERRKKAKQSFFSSSPCSSAASISFPLGSVSALLLFLLPLKSFKVSSCFHLTGRNIMDAEVWEKD